GGDSGVVGQSGRVLADSLTGKGGKITLEGQNIHLAGNSLTSATGKAGGGEVYVGGGWQGKDSHIHNASKVVMDRSATVDVSATQNGNGGTAVLWSDDYTSFQGGILARGGAQSGNGGRVETSSHRNLQAFGAVDASARAGHGGEWLLDPTDVTIVSGDANTAVTESGKGTEATLDTDTEHVFSPSATGAQVSADKISEQLNAGTSVTVQTSGTDTSGQSGNITVNANISKSAGADATLTLLADNSITTDNGVSIGSTAGKLNLNLLAGATTNNAPISLGNNINISLNGGDFYAGSGKDGNNVSLVYRNNGKIQAGNITMNVAGGLSGYAYNVLADNNLTINGPVSGSTGWGAPLTFSAGHLLTLNSPTTITLMASDTTHNGGRVVLSGSDGVSLNAASGNITLQAGNATTNSVTVTSANGSVSMAAGGNLSLARATVTSGKGQNITLKAAGTDHAMVNLSDSTLNSQGGDILIDRLTDTKAMTIKVANSTLNASAPATTDGTASESGNITLNAYNPNINLSAPAYDTTVRNAGVMLELSGNSTLTGRDLIMRTTLEGGNATGIPVFLNNATLNASHDIMLSGIARATGNTMPSPAAIELRGTGNVLTAGGNITIENQASGSNNGVYLNGSASGKAQLTAGGTITLNGSSAGNGAGVLVNNSILNASQAIITGSSSTGKGFSLTNTTLGGSLTDLVNVTFSSAGSGAGVTNLLDSSVVTSSNRDTMLDKSIENMTSIDMGGTAIFDDSAATDKGWTHNYTHADTPNGGWIFNNTTVTAGGAVNLSGVGFTNSTMDITAGGLNITQDQVIQMDNTTVNVSGDVVLHSANNLNLTGITLNEQSTKDAVLDLSSGGNVTLGGIKVTTAGGHHAMTVNAGGGVALSGVNIAGGAGVLDLSLLAGSTTNNAGISLGTLPNILLNGGDFYAGAGKDGNKVSLLFNNNGQIKAGNITMNVAGGLSGYAYGLLADNNLTINGPISGTTGWKVPLTFSAGHFLTLNSPTSISLTANDASNGGGRVVISGGDGVSLNTGNGSITLQAANATTNSVTITSANGTVSMNSGAGNIDLSKGNISAKGDITLQTDNGSISISGKNATEKANITSNEGNITVNSVANVAWGTAARFNYANLLAKKNINISGENTASGPQSGGWYLYGTQLNSVNVTSENINITGIQSGNIPTAGVWNSNRGLVLSGVNINASNVMNLNGNATGVVSGQNVGQPGGVYISSGTFHATRGEIVGNGSVNGVVFMGGAANFSGNISITGNSYLNATGSGAGYSGSGILFSSYYGGSSTKIGVSSNDTNVSFLGNGVSRGI
ncbi:beta strand repeat-containing protein, partial [Salmonella enterica]